MSPAKAAESGLFISVRREVDGAEITVIGKYIVEKMRVGEGGVCRVRTGDIARKLIFPRRESRFLEVLIAGIF